MSKQYTRDEIVELVAEAMCNNAGAELDEVPAREKLIWRSRASAALRGLEKAGVLIIQYTKPEKKGATEYAMRIGNTPVYQCKKG